MIRTKQTVDCDFCSNEDIKRYKEFKGYKHICEECYEELKKTKWV